MILMKKISKYINSTNFFISVLIILLIACITLSPSTGIINPYKEVDGHFIANPIIDEQVQFEGIYIARTDNYDENVLYYIPPVEYDILEVDGQYVFLSDEYYTNNLSGNIGKTVHVEGAFVNPQISVQKIDGKYFEGYIFKADKIELVK